MNNLWTFGDSFTDRMSMDYEWTRRYIEWKGYTPKIYPEILSEELGLTLQNHAIGGSGNHSIFENFCKVSDMIKEGDVVIFGWSDVTRFRVASDFGGWVNFTTSGEVDWNIIKHISPNVINEMFVNRNSVVHITEVNNWIKLINSFLSLKKCEVIHWNVFERRINSHFFMGYEIEQIKDETEGLIEDSHFSEKGHVQISEKLLNIYHRKINRPII